MSSIKLISDSTCDLSLQERELMNVDIIPLIVTFSEDAFKEGIDITPSKLFSLVKEKNMLPKTSAPSPLDFYNVFKLYVEAGFDVIYIGLSSKVSTTVQNAKMAAEHIGNKVKVIDSLNLCVGTAALIKHAYNYIKSGLSSDDVVKELENIVPDYKLFFTVETLDYLHMGGRCSSTDAIFGNMLNIKPIISMSVDGLNVWTKTRGKKKAINMMIEEVLKDKDRILLDEVHIGYTVGNENEGKIFKKMLIERTGITKIYEYTIGCVISSHCGEGTVGLGYFLKN